MILTTFLCFYQKTKCIFEFLTLDSIRIDILFFFSDTSRTKRFMQIIKIVISEQRSHMEKLKRR